MSCAALVLSARPCFLPPCGNEGRGRWEVAMPVVMLQVCLNSHAWCEYIQEDISHVMSHTKRRRKTSPTQNGS